MKNVIAIFDVGKTNKKLLLFDEQYKVVLEHSEQFLEITDEDGFPCEDVQSLRNFILESLKKILSDKRFNVTAVNFSAYGASFVCLDATHKEVTLLYNYLKPYPENLLRQFYDGYGGETNFSLQTASPVLGSLNSGMQLYRIKYERPELFKQIKSALHLPQYLTYLVSGRLCTDITSIGCHTNLWNFEQHHYHEWVTKEGLMEKMMPLVPSDKMASVNFSGHDLKVGTGLHDSSAALIPYLINFKEPFVLISTGTWCITLNPFNHTTLKQEELQKDCLCYLQYNGNPVKAARLFAGHEHDEQVKRIADYFNIDSKHFFEITFDAEIITKLQRGAGNNLISSVQYEFSERDLPTYSSVQEAYHQLIVDLVAKQVLSSNLVLEGTTSRIFVDGGFSRNEIYMNLLANAFPDMEVYATFMGQASALGAALAVHDCWNNKPAPSDIIELKYYASTHNFSK